MSEYIRPEYALVMLMIAPAAVGGILARNRGKNVLFWGILSALFPIFIMIVYFEKPLREVPGGFKRCISCGEFIRWKSVTCKYCFTHQPSPPNAIA